MILLLTPYTYFSDGALVYKRKPETTTHFLVLTDMNAGKTYATCLTFYRTYIVEKVMSDQSQHFFITEHMNNEKVNEYDQEIPQSHNHFFITEHMDKT